MRLFHFDYHFCVWAAEIRGAISGRQTEEHGSDNWLIMSQQSGFLHWHHKIIHTLGPVLYSGLFTMCRVKFSPSSYAQRSLCISWANSKICLTKKLYVNSVITQHLERQYTNSCNLFHTRQYSGLLECVFVPLGQYAVQVNAIEYSSSCANISINIFSHQQVGHREDSSRLNQLVVFTL